MVFCIFLSGLFQMTQIAMQKNELHYRQCKQEFWQLTNSLKKNALTELFWKEREEDFDSRESLELPAKSVSLAIYKTEFLKISLIIIQTNIHCIYIQCNFYSFKMCPTFHCNLTVWFTFNCCSNYSRIIVKWFTVFLL